MLGCAGGVVEVDKRASEDNARVIPLEPYLVDAANRPSLMDKLISLVQKVYDAHQRDVAPGSFNPEFTASATLFVCDGLKSAAMEPVFGTEDLLSKITIKVRLGPDVLSTFTSVSHAPGLASLPWSCVWRTVHEHHSGTGGGAVRSQRRAGRYVAGPCRPRGPAE